MWTLDCLEFHFWFSGSTDWIKHTVRAHSGGLVWTKEVTKQPFYCEKIKDLWFSKTWLTELDNCKMRDKIQKCYICVWESHETNSDEYQVSMCITFFFWVTRDIMSKIGHKFCGCMEIFLRNAKSDSTFMLVNQRL